MTFQHVVIDANPKDDRVFHGDVKGVGDIDGDGHVDIVFGGNDLAWYAYPNWEKSVVAVADQEFTTDMQVADMDGDGDLDLVVPDGSKGKISWFENPRPTGDPRRLWRSHLIGYQGDWAHDVEVADMNGDGKPDVVTRKRETYLWVQNGPDSFTRVELTSAMPGGEGTALADINSDGRLDVVQNGYWLEAPADVHSEWVKHTIRQGLVPQLSVAVADINSDEIPDVLFVPAESAGRLSWFEGPSRRANKWTEHVIDGSVDHVHSLEAGDFNNDGRIDVVMAEMHQSERRRVSVYLNGGGNRWKPQTLSTAGSHNLRVADIGSDGDLDVIGANWGGEEHPLELWENRLIARKASTGWTYTQLDDRRAKWGDFGSKKAVRYFGLAAGDIEGDGYGDIVSGRYVYRNPGRGAGKWERTDLGFNVDAMLLSDVDGDGRLDIIAESLPAVYWLKPLDSVASTWRATLVGTLPATEHVNSQGYAAAQIVPGGPPEFVLTAGDGVYYFEVGGTVPWRRTKIAAGTSEEGLAVGDLDGDGDIDVACSMNDGRQVVWFENPGIPAGAWKRHDIGVTKEWADRVAVADVNQDGKLDVVVSEETPYGGASVYWFAAPAAPGGGWSRHTIVTQYSTNSLDVADIDGDGAVDVITGEHRGSRKLSIWRNTGRGAGWTELEVDTGKENHLGARLVDLNGDGAAEIIGIGWDSYRLFHLWSRGPASTHKHSTDK